MQSAQSSNIILKHEFVTYVQRLRQRSLKFDYFQMDIWTDW